MPRPKKYTDDECKLRRKEHNKQWVLRNKDKYIASTRKSIENRTEEQKEVKKAYDREYHKKHYERKTIDKGLPSVKSGRYGREYLKQKRQNDPNFKLKINLSNRIREVFKKIKSNKNNSTLEILGCTLNEFKHHIESQFEPWMTWDNYGCKTPTGLNMTWDLDHIIPIGSAASEDDVKRLNHYTNFQPLCSYVNRFIKRDRLI